MNTYGATAGPGQSIAQPACLSGHLDNFDSQLDKASTVLDELRLVADRLNGSAPRAITAGDHKATTSEPGTLVSQYGGRCSTLANLLSAMQDELGRISRSL